jgi:hypothetical protein
LIPNAVIASEAKQSIEPKMDCFVAEPVIGRRFAPTRWLLAMTGGAINAVNSPASEKGLSTLASSCFVAVAGILLGTAAGLRGALRVRPLVPAQDMR